MRLSTAPGDSRMKAKCSCTLRDRIRIGSAFEMRVPFRCCSVHRAQTGLVPGTTATALLCLTLVLSKNLALRTMRRCEGRRRIRKCRRPMFCYYTVEHDSVLRRGRRE